MNNPSVALYSAEQTRQIDRLALDDEGIAGIELMARAAGALWSALRQRWPQAGRVVIACGPGNNGGDGFLLGLEAMQAGVDVCVVALASAAHGDAAEARQRYVDAGGRVLQAETLDGLPPADVYVDALFGSGFNRPTEGLAAELIRWLNDAPGALLAVDVPSGLQADSGAMLGECVHADATLCLVAWKRGLFTHEAVACCGERALARLDLPDHLYAEVAPSAELLQPWRLPARAPTAHKGHFGHVLVVGGEHGFGGAVRLAGEAALRCGAGLVSVATRERHVAALLAGRPELMVHGVDADGMPGALLQASSVLVAGPGLGQRAWGRRLLEQVLGADQPLVLDADGLNLIAGRGLSFAARAAVLTPHPGEAARLLQCDTARIQADRFRAAQTLAQQFACVVVLKGAGSLIAHPDGRLAVCPWGNPGMASGGMGDVLSGIIGALLAQQLTPWQAATLAVGWHARAGDIAAADGQRGLLAGDLLPALRQLAGASHGDV